MKRTLPYLTALIFSFVTFGTIHAMTEASSFTPNLLEETITLQLIDDCADTITILKSYEVPLKQVILCNTFKNCLENSASLQEPLVLFSSSISPLIFDLLSALLKQINPDPCVMQGLKEVLVENLESFSIQHLEPLLDAALYLDCPELYELIMYLCQSKISELLFNKNNVDDVLSFTTKMETTPHSAALFKAIQAGMKNPLSIELLAAAQTSFKTRNISKVSTHIINNKLIVLKKEKNSLFLIDFNSEEIIAQLNSPTGLCNSDCIAGNGEKIAATSWDSHLLIWDVASQKLCAKIYNENGFFDSICLSYDGTYCASAKPGDSTITIWNTTTGDCVNKLTLNYPVNALSYVGDSSMLALVTHNHTLVLIDSSTGAVISLLEGHTDTITGICFNEVQKTIVSSSRDKSLKIWDINSGICLQTLVSIKDLRAAHCTADATLIVMRLASESLEATELIDLQTNFNSSSLVLIDFMTDIKRTTMPLALHRNQNYTKVRNQMPTSFKKHLAIL